MLINILSVQSAMQIRSRFFIPFIFLLLLLLLPFSVHAEEGPAILSNLHSVFKDPNAPMLPANAIDTLVATDCNNAYFYNLQSNGFYSFLLPDIAASTFIGGIGRNIYAMDSDPTGTIVYAIDNGSLELGTIDKGTGAFTAIAGLTGLISGQTTTGLTVDPTTNTYYVSTADGGTSTLYTLAVGTGALTQVGTIANYSLTIDIAIDSTGQMYGHDIATDELFTIDKSTGATTLVGPTGFDANFAQGMDFDWSDDTLYLWLYVGGTFTIQFCSADLSTGVCTVLSTVSGEAEGFIDPNPCCAYTIDPTSASISHCGGQITVLVDASDESCGWPVTEELDWVSVSSETGVGSGAVTISVDQNTGFGRSGIVIIAGKVFTITQGSQADITGDGCVDDNDFRAWFWGYLANWGRLASAEPACDSNCDGRIFSPDFLYFWPAYKSNYGLCNPD